MGREKVEAIAVSLVREYLSRKGFRQSLKTLDKEFPRTEDSINNRILLAKEMHIERLMRKNKELPDPYRTMIEVVVSYVTERRSLNGVGNHHTSLISNHSDGDGRAAESPQLTLRRSSSVKDIIHTKESREDFFNHLESKEEIQTSETGEKIKPLRSTQNSDPLNLHGHTTTQWQSFQLNPSGCQQLSNYISCPAKLPSQAEPILPGNRSHSRRLVSGVLTRTKESRVSSKSTREHKEPIDLSFMDQTSSYSSVRGKDNLQTKDSESTELERVDRQESSRPKKVSNDHLSKEKPSRRQGEKKIGDILFDDIEDELDEDLKEISLGPQGRKQRLQLDSTPISLEAAMELKQLIFGSPLSSFPSEWKKQSFSFSEIRTLEYGIVQLKGGPCGVLAAVQAVFMQFLLFDEGHKGRSTKTLSVSVEKQRLLLAQAVASILWRAGECQSASVTLLSTMAKFAGGRQCKNDGFTETLTIFHFKEYSDLLNFMTGSIAQWQGENSYGCILLLYSAIFSRGITRIKQDMDEIDGTLIGSHGYCTQELVNLLLTGRAVSNVFDGIMELDSGGNAISLLKGIEEQADIGFLSLFEHYKSCQVGNNYKNPKFPIWVVCSESHFSVLFSTTFDALNKSAKKFDLYYYDGLALQDEEIRLTVDITKPWKYDDTTDDLIPPLELCLRTKWTNCAISWNGTDPLL